MVISVKNESPFQILASSFTIGPSPTGYDLQIGATPDSFTTLFSVSANTPRMVTGVANGSFYRLKNNVGEVKVNWVRSCNNGGSGDGNAQELQPVSDFPLSPIDGTVVALSSGDTVGLYQFDGTEWTSVGGSDLTDYYTKQETDAAISAATTPIEEHIDDVERVTASALTEIHEDILDISAATGNFYTKAETDTAIADAIADIPQPDLSNYYTKDQIAVKEEVISRALNEIHDDVLDISGATSDFYTKQEIDTAISTATAGKADAASVTPNDFMQFPKWNAQGVITGTTGNNLATTGFYLNGVRTTLIKEQMSGDIGDVYAPTTPGTAGQILVSSGSRAPVWANDDKVSSASVSTIWRGSQAEYDAITTKDPNTLYIIVNS